MQKEATLETSIVIFLVGVIVGQWLMAIPARKSR